MGTPVTAPPSPVTPPSYNGFAITSFVLGLLGILCLQPLGIGAVIFGPLALGQLNRQRAEGGPEQQGRALAVAGTVTGAIAIVLLLAVITVLGVGGWDGNWELGF